MVVRRIARPLLASVFISRGADLLRSRERRAQLAASLPAGELGVAPEQAALAVSGVLVGAGALLAAGRFPRLSALALAVALVPTAAAANPFWAEKDPLAKREQRVAFLNDLGLLGGVLMAAAAGGKRRRGLVEQAKRKLP